MGLFGGKAKTEDGAGDDKARRFAERKGIDVAGAVLVDKTFDEGADRVLVVHPDRVELHHLGKMGSLMRAGAGSEVIPAGKVSAVSVAREGIWSKVTVHTSGADLEYRTDVKAGPQLAAAIRGITA